VHAKRSPRIDMVLDRYCTTGAPVLADGQVLVEGGSALDRGLIHSGGLVDIVRRSIGDDCALVCSPCGPAEVVRLLVDVVFNERVGRPACTRLAVAV
jgi:hypothetical protein